MDPGRSAEKDPRIPSQRSIGGGGRHPIAHPRQSSLNSGRSTPTRDHNSPSQEEKKDRPEPTPPPRRTSTTNTRNVPPPYQKCIPAKDNQFMCVPTHLAHFFRQSGIQQTSDTGFGRQSTYIQQDIYSQQGAYYSKEDTYEPEYEEHITEQHMPSSEKSPEATSQRSKSSPVVRSTSETQSKSRTKLQKTIASTDRPPWKEVWNTCKPPGIYPEPLKPLPPVSKPTSAVAPVRQHHSETQISSQDYQISAKQNQISTRQTSKEQSQISAKPSQMSAHHNQISAKHSEINTRQSQTSVQPVIAKHSPLSHKSQLRNTSSADRQPNEKRQSSEVSDISTITPVVPQQEVPLSSYRLPDEAGSFSSDNARFRGEHQAIRRSSERVCVHRGPDAVSLSSPIRFEDENGPSDAESTAYTAGPNRRSSERIHEECETIMQKLAAELALTGDFPSKEELCVRVSLGEQVMFDGQRKRFTISEPLQSEQVQDDCTEVYATPSASSPRVSAQLETVKPTETIPEASAEESSEAEVRSKALLTPTTEVVEPPKKVVHTLHSIQEILAPPTEPPPTTIISPSFEEIMPPPAGSSFPLSKEPLPSTSGHSGTPEERPRSDPQVRLDKEGSTGIKMKTAENEALNTEFLYYSTVLKNLLPVLSRGDDRCRLVPWVKKLFSPEYCARLLRDKRNRFLLHLALVLCNDEVIGVFLKPPPEGTMPSVGELCSTRYPPAAWECDSAWLDHLEDIPPGVARMPCPWHSTGCPAPEHATDSTDLHDGLTCPEICHPWRVYDAGVEAFFGWTLDQEFKLLLYLSRALKPLMKISKDRQRMVGWLRFLCTVTPDCCVALRMLRNDYAKLLLAYVQDDRLTGPFANDPVWGQPLPPLGNEGESRPFADPASGDVDEFLRTVPVPNEGAFCYVAVDGIPVTPITRPTASASLLQR